MRMRDIGLTLVLMGLSLAMVGCGASPVAPSQARLTVETNRKAFIVIGDHGQLGVTTLTVDVPSGSVVNVLVRRMDGLGEKTDLVRVDGTKTVREDF